MTDNRVIKWDDIGFWLVVTTPRIAERTDNRRNKEYSFKASVVFHILDTRGGGSGGWMELENRAVGNMQWKERAGKYAYSNRYWMAIPEGFVLPPNCGGKDGKPISVCRHLTWTIRLDKPSKLPPAKYSELSDTAVKSYLPETWESEVEQTIQAIRDSLVAAERSREASGRVKEACHLIALLAKGADQRARKMIRFDEKLEELKAALKEAQLLSLVEELAEVEKDPNWDTEDGKKPIDPRVLKAAEKHSKNYLPNPFSVFPGHGNVEIPEEDVL